jgi:phosphodiesterase/alkaline phosphatase D-like protein
VRRPAFLGGGAGGFTPTVPAITVDFAWIGGVDTGGATVKARSADAVAMTLRYDTDPGLANWIPVVGCEGAVEVYCFDLTGLAADTTYYIGFIGSSLAGQLHTFPSGSSSFSIAAASCGGQGTPEYHGAANTTNTPAYDRIREREPLLLIHMGDLHYRNLNTTSSASYRTAYKDVLANSRFNELCLNVPIAYVWDDHDFGPNDSDGTYSGKATAQQVYREYVPHYDLDDAAAIYQTFVIGRVRFILLDTRSGRSPDTNTDNASKTRLGATQKQWLKDTLLAASEPLIVLEVGSWIGNSTSFPDGWESFSTERTELFDYFSANGLMDRLLLMGGDVHELISDDGTNTNFETGAATDGPPYVGFAPLDGDFNDFSATAQNKYQTENQQYGTLDFVDTGTQITVTAKGWACPDTSTESQEFSLSKVYVG